MLPNFLIIGAAKSGTTSLAQYMQQHPQIFMSQLKETNFFAFDGQLPTWNWWGEPPTALLETITDIKTYQSQFQGVTAETAIGEASPLYLYCRSAPKHIYQHIPNTKLIAVLRNPIDRAFSHFMHLIRDNREPQPDFMQAVGEEKNRMQAGWTPDYFYKDMGFYALQLRRYFDFFSKSQIRVFLYEDMVADIQTLLQEMFRFLDVDHSFHPETSLRHNVSGIPKSRKLLNFVRKPNPLKTAVRPLIPQRIRVQIGTAIINRSIAKSELPQTARKNLIETYRTDILNLQDLIQRDLSGWLTL